VGLGAIGTKIQKAKVSEVKVYILSIDKTPKICYNRKK
jgi:hypothetical protein